jgi:hypothetical protein
MKKIIATAAVILLPTMAVAETFDEAFEMNRAMYGKNHSFTWEGKQYKTLHEEEVEASVEATQANAEALIAKAKAKNEEVAKVGFEWKLTQDIIKSAEAALAEGSFQKAMDLAAQAKYHARMGLRQHDEAEKSWYLSQPQ